MADIVKSIPSMREALKVCVRKSGLQEKQIYLELDIDSAQWSRIMTGQANLSYDKLVQFLEICGNDIPLQWLAYQRGYELRVIPKTLEEQLEKAKEENRELQTKLKNIVEVLQQANLKIE